MREPVSITTVTTKNEFKKKLKDMKITNLNRIVISHIEINLTFLLKLLWAMQIFLWLLKQKLMNLSQQASLLYVVSLHHILTELKMEEGYLSILGIFVYIRY